MDREETNSLVMDASSTSSMQNNPIFLEMNGMRRTYGFSSIVTKGSANAKELTDERRAVF